MCSGECGIDLAPEHQARVKATILEHRGTKIRRMRHTAGEIVNKTREARVSIAKPEYTEGM